MATSISISSRASAEVPIVPVNVFPVPVTFSVPSLSATIISDAIVAVLFPAKIKYAWYAVSFLSLIVIPLLAVTA